MSSVVRLPETYLGLTASLSLTSSAQPDHDRASLLVNELEENGCYEGGKEMPHRVVTQLNLLFIEWIKDLSTQRNISPTMGNTVGGHVYTFGSYRLGVHNNGEDIDLLCIAPHHINREGYFDSFYILLQQQPEVKKLRAVPYAFVPVIKMVYDGIDIDMTFVRLPLKELVDNQSLNDPSILKHFDITCVRSLNGRRVTDEILNQVPNKDTFRLALRAIKLWAKTHGIYSNVLGYLGGVSWAILAARVCQLYPNDESSTIVQKFFMVFCNWKWPQPVFLKKLADVPRHGFTVWDPRQNVPDRFHLMPIITPVYPQQNSTFNVSRSTLNVMREEFRLSLSICAEIIAGRATWDKLFKPTHFFGKYRHYIVLEASSSTEYDQIRWHGHVESKVRHLVALLEREALALARVWPNIYPSLEEGKEKRTCYWFIGLVIMREENGNMDDSLRRNVAIPTNEPLPLELINHLKEFCEGVIRTAIDIKLWKDGMRVEAFYKTRRKLIAYLPFGERHKVKPERRSVKLFASSTATSMSEIINKISESNLSCSKVDFGKGFVSLNSDQKSNLLSLDTQEGTRTLRDTPR